MTPRPSGEGGECDLLPYPAEESDWCASRLWAGRRRPHALRRSQRRRGDRVGQRLRRAELRIPTPEEFAAFTGAHCRNIYRSLPAGWRCPGCSRSKFEVLRWTMLYPHLPSRHEGWAGGFHNHHDHCPEHLGGSARFERVVICEQCNSADGQVKRKLKLPAWFSFSPEEIGAFVRSVPHGFHVIDYERAREIFDLVSSSPGFGRPKPSFW